MAMNRLESKYFNTAAKMDEVFLGLLNENKFQFMTVKEIWQRAGGAPVHLLHAL